MVNKEEVEAKRKEITKYWSELDRGPLYDYDQASENAPKPIGIIEIETTVLKCRVQFEMTEELVNKWNELAGYKRYHVGVYSYYYHSPSNKWWISDDNEKMPPLIDRNLNLPYLPCSYGEQASVSISDPEVKIKWWQFCRGKCFMMEDGHVHDHIHKYNLPKDSSKYYERKHRLENGHIRGKYWGFKEPEPETWDWEMDENGDYVDVYRKSEFGYDENEDFDDTELEDV
jgi:hypothetical protein